MAQTTVDIYGTVIGGADVFNTPAGQEQRIGANNRGDLRSVESLPLKSELVRMGAGWEVAIATASAFTYVAVWPTTRAELVLYNNEPAGGKSLIIDSAWMHNITSTAAANPMELLAQNVPVVATAPADDTAQLLSSLSGKARYGGNVRKAVANTTAGQTTNLWRPIAGQMLSGTATLGAAVFAELWGLYIVPPQGVFALAGLAGTVAGTAIIGVRFFEVQLALG